MTKLIKNICVSLCVCLMAAVGVVGSYQYAYADADQDFIQRLLASTGLAVTDGGIITGQEVRYLIPAEAGRDGATNTAWAAGVGDVSEVTLAASQTADVWIIPVTGLNIGDTISAFSIQAQIESAGGAVTLDADLRRQTNVAGDPTDASVGAITQVSVTADTAVDTEKASLTEVVAVGEAFYFLITGTTAASTDIRFLSMEVSVTRGTE